MIFMAKLNYFLPTYWILILAEDLKPIRDGLSSIKIMLLSCDLRMIQPVEYHLLAR